MDFVGGRTHGEYVERTRALDRPAAWSPRSMWDTRRVTTESRAWPGARSAGFDKRHVASRFEPVHPGRKWCATD